MLRNCQLIQSVTKRTRLTQFAAAAYSTTPLPPSKKTPPFVAKLTTQRKLESEDFSRFGWKSAAAFIASSGILYAYFEYEKAKIAKFKAEAAQKEQGVGKPQIGGPFSLVNTEGVPVSDADFRGKFMLLYFGYTFCPDVCPEELDKMAKVVDNLKNLRKDQTIVPIFISCDPKRDSIENIKEYLKDFHPDFIGMTGTHAQIKRAAKAYRLYFSAPPLALDDDDSDYLVDHSIFFYLVDPDGKYIAHFGKQETSDSVTVKILDFLKLKGM
ncbi:Cu-binding protein [Physocladia obscura]|uniref:Cu-binding protein n=1 Tax=Physocladia obscura TaxID=109957 RepID=A0AAD5T9U9_9FUNG|nr:Cu-binding protein [Physocladia obscura]